MSQVQPYDPYKTYKFLIKDDKNNVVAGLSKVSELKRTTAVNKYRSGTAEEIKTPGITTYEPITMERGITQDKTFRTWAEMVHSYADPTEKEGYKKNLTLEIMDGRGKTVHRYFLYNCWVSEFVTVPGLDASANTVAIEHVKLEIEGYARDDSLQVQ